MKVSAVKLSIVILCILILNIAFPFKTYSTENVDFKSGSEFFFLLDTYEEYLNKYKFVGDPDREIFIRTDRVDHYEGDVKVETGIGDYTGKCVVTGESSLAQWTFHVENEGFYSIEIEYYPISGRGIDIERSVFINGTVPYREAYSVVFKRRWIDREAVVENPGGNDVSPTQIQEPVWMTRYIYESGGYYMKPLKFYLHAGENNISLRALAEPMAIRSVRFFKYEEPVTYNQLQTEYKQKGYLETSEILIDIEAERTFSKSDSKIRPKTDRSSPLTQPYHPSKLKLNIIGGPTWQYNGEYIEWEVDVPVAGLYKIGLRYRQEQKTSGASVRRLYINGKVPFVEMENIAFTYDNEWQVTALIDETGEPYLFYFDKGINIIRLEVTLGNISGILREIEDTIHSLNEIYRNIIVYTGTNPDPFTDYALERIIPNTVSNIKKQGEKLCEISEKMRDLGAVIGGDTAFIDTFSDQLIQMYENPHTINNRLASFKTNIGSLGSWLNELTVSPLKLDRIIVASRDITLPKAKAGFFARLFHEIRAFFGSFRENYSVIDGSGKKYQDNITVWLGSLGGMQGQTGGRDQALLIKNIIESDFSEKTGIGVNIKLVDAGAMLPAILAGNAPDIVVSVSGGIPVQYALRSAITDLSTFDGFSTVCGRFPQGAFIPVTYGGKVYGMPESLTWDMLFYRKDILFELGIEVPQTWDEMINLIPVLARNNMEIGINPGMYYTFMYQNGLKIYDEQTDRCLFDKKEATGLFGEFTNLFVNYRLPVSYNMFNRFRTGEMPLVVAPYNSYNTMVIFAPEIRGLWDFSMIPGFKKTDGGIDRTTIAAGSYTMMFEQSEKKQSSWEFIKWWTDAKTQKTYGVELEGLLGPAGRYTTANIEALKGLPWAPESLDMLLKQQEWISGIPEVPGGYFTARHFLNAFYAVYNRGSEPRETLMQYTYIINSEIEKKRKEFGFE